MKYSEIIKLTDIEEREIKLKEYYESIGANDWLNNNTKQKIRFKDRFEYKQNNKYHRLTGPSIEYHNGKKGLYYIYGEQMNYDEWKPKAKKLLRSKKLKRTLKK